MPSLSRFNPFLGCFRPARCSTPSNNRTIIEGPVSHIAVGNGFMIPSPTKPVSHSLDSRSPDSSPSLVSRSTAHTSTRGGSSDEPAALRGASTRREAAVVSEELSTSANSPFPTMGNRITITLVHVNGKRLELEVEDTDSVSDLQDRLVEWAWNPKYDLVQTKDQVLHSSCQAARGYMHLYDPKQKKQLLPSSTLADSSIEDGAVLSVLFSPDASRVPSEASHASKLRIFVNGLDGEIRPADVDLSFTVAEFKEVMCAPASNTLSFRGKFLLGPDSLRSCGVELGSVVSLKEGSKSSPTKGFLLGRTKRSSSLGGA